MFGILRNEAEKERRMQCCNYGFFSIDDGLEYEKAKWGGLPEGETMLKADRPWLAFDDDFADAL